MIHFVGGLRCFSLIGGDSGGRKLGISLLEKFFLCSLRGRGIRSMLVCFCCFSFSCVLRRRVLMVDFWMFRISHKGGGRGVGGGSVVGMEMEVGDGD